MIENFETFGKEESTSTELSDLDISLEIHIPKIKESPIFQPSMKPFNAFQKKLDDSPTISDSSSNEKSKLMIQLKL